MRICIKNKFRIPEEPCFFKALDLRSALDCSFLMFHLFLYIAPHLANTKLQEVMCNKGQKQVHFIWLLVQYCHWRDEEENDSIELLEGTCSFHLGIGSLTSGTHAHVFLCWDHFRIWSLFLELSIHLGAPGVAHMSFAAASPHLA